MQMFLKGIRNLCIRGPRTEQILLIFFLILYVVLL
jgi:hypothetical protein